MYHVGDQVIVRRDLTEGQKCHAVQTITEDMLEFAGEIAKVTNVFDDNTYELDCDGGTWNWPGKALLPASDTPTKDTAQTETYTLEQVLDAIVQGGEAFLEALEEKDRDLLGSLLDEYLENYV